MKAYVGVEVQLHSFLAGGLDAEWRISLRPERMNPSETARQYLLNRDLRGRYGKSWMIWKT
jgi:hypothetical protein